MGGEFCRNIFVSAKNLLILDVKMMGTYIPNDILHELSQMGSAATKNVLLKHGAREPCFGVKVGDMKKIAKKVKKDHALSLKLYSTGNYDAMYLAGLIADETKITKKDLQHWVEAAYAGIAEYTVPWVAAESEHGWEVGIKWINSAKSNIAAAGWSTLTSVLSIAPNETLDQKAIEKLLYRIEKEIHVAPDRVRYTMNWFVIAAGAYVPALTKLAKVTAKKIGSVTVERNGTACKMPSGVDYIAKIEAMGRIGKKKKQARC
jgi:3-methyladenine DNA glycosylase AlkD